MCLLPSTHTYRQPDLKQKKVTPYSIFVAVQNGAMLALPYGFPLLGNCSLELPVVCLLCFPNKHLVTSVLLVNFLHFILGYLAFSHPLISCRFWWQTLDSTVEGGNCDYGTPPVFSGNLLWALIGVLDRRHYPQFWFPVPPEAGFQTGTPKHVFPEMS